MFLQAKEDFESGCNCLQKYSLEDRNQSARSACRTKLTRFRSHRQLYRCLTINFDASTFDHFWTRKYDFLAHSNTIQTKTSDRRKDGPFVYKGRSKQDFFNLGAIAFKSTHQKTTIKVQDHPAELNNSCLGPSDSYTGALQSTLTCQVNF